MSTKYKDLDRSKYGDCFWAMPHEEQFHHTDIDDAIRRWVEGWFGGELTLDDLPDGDEVVVRAMRKEVIPEGRPDHEWLLEWLADSELSEYLDPEDEPNWPPEVVEAAKSFCSLVREKAPVWSCVEVAQVSINIKEWLIENKVGE